MAASFSIVIPKPVLDAAPATTASEAGDAGLAALTARMARGEEEAFREFHGGWFHRLFRYVLVLMRGDEHAARDVTQEALLVAKYTDRRAVRDIAREAGLTEEAVESRLSRARAALRRMTLKLLRHETES